MKDNEIRSPMFVETLNSMIGFFHDYKEENKAFVKIFYRIIKKVCFIDKHVYVDCSNIWNDLKLTLEKNQSLRNVSFKNT